MLMGKRGKKREAQGPARKTREVKICRQQKCAQRREILCGRWLCGDVIHCGCMFRVGSMRWHLRLVRSLSGGRGGRLFLDGANAVIRSRYKSTGAVGSDVSLLSGLQARKPDNLVGCRRVIAPFVERIIQLWRVSGGPLEQGQIMMMIGLRLEFRWRHMFWPVIAPGWSCRLRCSERDQPLHVAARAIAPIVVTLRRDIAVMGLCQLRCGAAA